MEKINFEDIRAGDRIKVVDNYESGGLVEVTFTVKRIQHDVLCSAHAKISAVESAPQGASRYWYLVERSKPTFKVGDTITGEQVADLPDGAVFDLNDGCVALRYKIDGQVYSARGSVLSPANYRTLGYHILKIVFLPEA